MIVTKIQLDLWNHRESRWYSACVEAAARWLKAKDVNRCLRCLQIARDAETIKEKMTKERE